MKNCFIVPYFGELPNYFNLLLKTCASNKDMFDWIFFIDDKRKRDWPDNVKVYFCEFQDIQNLIKSKFDFDAKIDKPYKLCDYKPAYGYIFEEYIEKYDFWGHCDIDCLYGNLSTFFNDEIEKYDKILQLGHMTLYKNNWTNNRRFMLPIDGQHRYREVYQTNEACMFDEDNYKNYLNINDIWREYKFSIKLMDDQIANIWYKGNDFRVSRQLVRTDYIVEPKFRNIFYWKNGKIIRLWVDNEKLQVKEYIYIHLMARKMKISPNTDNSDVVKIIPNIFCGVKNIPSDVYEFNKEKWKAINFQSIIIKFRNFKSKINIFFKGIQYNDR